MESLLASSPGDASHRSMTGRVIVAAWEAAARCVGQDAFGAAGGGSTAQAFGKRRPNVLGRVSADGR